MNVVISDAKYVATQETRFKSKEKVGLSISGSDSGKVYNEDGSLAFLIKGKHISLSDAIWLKDGETEEPVLGMKKKLVSLHQTVFVVKPNEDVVGIVKIKLGLKKKISLFLGDSDDGDPTYTAEGGMRGKRFDVCDSNGDVVCKVEKDSLNMRNMLTDQDTYNITVPAGGDSAFFVLVCTIIDELFHDEE
uniref:Tubby C-terminal domain-containing protein n=1 Tax=Rhodosorus marinus TaxID=101924 RepID=A0A7S0G3U6_9RHOD|mmetsp:Transcript_3709/g.5262  ORF Transcript_3709/g.5262 Transcript_3709/m.5262 type:complete len:190 (+) Transcript_3709:128-697(+)